MTCTCGSPVRLVDPADENTPAGFFASDGSPTLMHDGPGWFQRDTDHAAALDPYTLPYCHEDGDEHRHEGVTDIHPGGDQPHSHDDASNQR